MYVMYPIDTIKLTFFMFILTLYPNCFVILQHQVKRFMLGAILSSDLLLLYSHVVFHFVSNLKKNLSPSISPIEWHRYFTVLFPKPVSWLGLFCHLLQQTGSRAKICQKKVHFLEDLKTHKIILRFTGLKTNNILFLN